MAALKAARTHGPRWRRCDGGCNCRQHTDCCQKQLKPPPSHVISLLLATGPGRPPAGPAHQSVTAVSRGSRLADEAAADTSPPHRQRRRSLLSLTQLLSNSSSCARRHTRPHDTRHR